VPNPEEGPIDRRPDQVGTPEHRARQWPDNPNIRGFVTAEPQRASDDRVREVHAHRSPGSMAVAARQHLASASPDGSEMTGNATMCAQVDRVCGASHGERSPMQPNI
jgi:hypothetical protein